VAIQFFNLFSGLLRHKKDLQLAMTIYITKDAKKPSSAEYYQEYPPNEDIMRQSPYFMILRCF